MRERFERIDAILSESKLDSEFVGLAIKEQGIDVGKLTAKEGERFARTCALGLRASVARCLMSLSHRDFCARVTDSPLLQWFLHLGELDQVETFAKSTSWRFEQLLGAESLRRINELLVLVCSAPAAEDS